MYPIGGNRNSNENNGHDMRRGNAQMYAGNMYPTASHPYLGHPQHHASVAPARRGMCTVNTDTQSNISLYYNPQIAEPENFGYMSGTSAAFPTSARYPQGGKDLYGRGGGGSSRGRYGGDGGTGRGYGDGGASWLGGRGGGYEVHDNQLKVPIAVGPDEVVPTTGSNRLFTSPPQPTAYGSRSAFRICEAFRDGGCTTGEKCHDIHVIPEYLSITRLQMTTWLQNCEDEFNNMLRYNPSHTFRIFVTDLKEVVDVPVTALAFTKGLYVDPSTRARRTRAAHSHNHDGNQNSLTTQVPTGCGLYATDPSQCKWGRWCNQVHIDPRWMRDKKDGFQQWFDKLENDFNAYPPHFLFTVHDPQLRMSLQLPKFSIASFTRGLFQGSNKKAPSACLLFQKGRCTAGSCCNQIHILPPYLNLVRAAASETGADPYGQPASSPAGRELERLTTSLLAQQQQEQEQHQLPLPINLAPPGGGGASGVGGGPVAGNQSTELSTADSYIEDCSGALFEHIQVDEDSLDATVHANFGTAGGDSSTTNHESGEGVAVFVSSSTHIRSTRHVNPDGSYTNNPYGGSITSLPDGSGSFSPRPLVTSGSGTVYRAGSAAGGPRGGGGAPANGDSSGAAASFLSRAPAAALTQAAGKGRAAMRLSTPQQSSVPAAFADQQTLPHVSMPHFISPAQQQQQRSGHLNASATGSNLGGANNSSSGQWGSVGWDSGGHPSGNHQGSSHNPTAAARTDHQAPTASSPTMQHASRVPRANTNSAISVPLHRSHTGPEHLLTPQEFDSSLHFSPSPLLSFNASATSASRQCRGGDDESSYSNINAVFRAGGGPNTSHSHSLGGNNSGTRDNSTGNRADSSTTATGHLNAASPHPYHYPQQQQQQPSASPSASGGDGSYAAYHGTNYASYHHATLNPSREASQLRHESCPGNNTTNSQNGTSASLTNETGIPRSPKEGQSMGGGKERLSQIVK